MASDHDDSRLRQYLLGALPDEQCAAIEEEYFLREEALDQIWAVEHELIDDYLAERLTADERERFDRHYLASPVHQHRVAVARQLRHAGAARQGLVGEATPSPNWLMSIVRSFFEQPLALKVAVAAVVFLIAMGVSWLFRARMMPSVEPPRQTAIPPQSPGSVTPTPQSPVPAPVVLGISLSPIGVRGADDSLRVTIPPGTDRVIVHLESDGAPHPFTSGRATVRTVSGREVWNGPAVPESPARPPAFARLDIPADRLAPEDYIVTLFEPDASGRDREGFRFFLRIRAR